MIIDASRVASIVLGGGEGKRLFPLTQFRCKPSVPFGSYRLIDIPLSSCLHANIRKIFVVTQFLSSSLHRHLIKTYRLDSFSHGFIEVLAPEQKPGVEAWYQGTADAVRQNIAHISEAAVDYFLILSGDQLYNMDFRKLILFAKESGADLTISALPVGEAEAHRMGILKISDCGQVIDFVEKPQDKEVLSQLELTKTKDSKKKYLGSMGIYVFKKEALIKLLKEDQRPDFGQHLIPTQVKKGNVFAYIHDGYWEDIGTIDSFYKANLALTESDCHFNCYDEKSPFFTAYQYLPSPKIIQSSLNNAIVSNGCVIEAKELTRSVIGARSVIKKGCVIEDSVLFGNDYYESHIIREDGMSTSPVIDENCIIKKAILDMNVHLGKGVKLVNKKNLSHYDGENVFIRDGVIIVTQGAIIPSGFEL